MKVEIYGSSDDLIEVIINGEELLEFSGTVDEKGGTGYVLVSSMLSDHAIHVNPIYDGSWSFAIGMVADGSSLPAWGYAVGSKHAYSTKVTITSEDDLEVIWVVRDPLRVRRE